MVDLVENVIRNKILSHFSPSELIIENESHQHNVPKNSESHFKLTVVSSLFAGKRAVARHQLIYSLLQEELVNGLHALALHLYTPEEWDARNRHTTASPKCMGGESSGNHKNK